MIVKHINDHENGNLISLWKLRNGKAYRYRKTDSKKKFKKKMMKMN